MEVWQTSDLRPLRLREEKKEDRRKEGKKLQGKNIMAPLLHRAAIIITTEIAVCTTANRITNTATWQVNADGN